MDNVIVATFDVESEARQAFSVLKNDAANAHFSILEMAVVKNDRGTITPIDSFVPSLGANVSFTLDEPMDGLAGLVGKSFSLVLGASIGLLEMGTEFLAGNGAHTDRVSSGNPIFVRAGRKLGSGKTAVIALVREEEPKALDHLLQGFDCTIERRAAGELAAGMASSATGVAEPPKVVVAETVDVVFEAANEIAADALEATAAVAKEVAKMADTARDVATVAAVAAEENAHRDADDARKTAREEADAVKGWPHSADQCMNGGKADREYWVLPKSLCIGAVVAVCVLGLGAILHDVAGRRRIS